MDVIRKLSAVLMAVVIAVSAVSVIGFSAAQADEVPEATVLNETEEPVRDKDDIPAVGATEAPAPTEAPTDIPTEAPAEPTVGKVKNITRTSNKSNYISLTWDVVEGASGYNVYICNADAGNTYVKTATVTTNSCTVKNLAQGTQYHFRVSAFINCGGKVIEGEMTTKKTSTHPCAPTGLTKWRASTVLELAWTRNTKASGYRIYRKSAESGNKEVLYKIINGNQNNSFQDKSVKQGRTYTYRVKSFRNLYGGTINSDISASESFIAGLSGPNFSVVSRCQRVNLTWKKNSYATHYEVYYSTKPDNSTFTKLTTTNKLFYNTAKLSNNKTYYFRVRPIYVKGGTTITGTSLKKNVTVTNKAYGRNPGSTYIEISIDQQRMWVYKGGKELVSTDVVTGNKGTSDTPKGYYSVNNKTRNTYLNGAGYSSFVNYWMAFIGGSYGIHDASWRSAYGGTHYTGNGSHGCVNTPKSNMVKIYNNIPVGTPVIIY